MSSDHRRIPGQQYEYGHVYTAEELREVTPEDLIRWLNMRTFGVAEAGRDMAIKEPILRANTLFLEKSSFFLYARSPAWLALWVKRRESDEVCRSE
jgi:hypothetical protein